MTETQAIGLMQLAASLWPRQKVAQETVEGYVLLLFDEDYASCLEAVKRLGKTSKFFPQLSEIVDEARAIRRAGIEEGDADLSVPALPAQTPATFDAVRAKGRRQLDNLRRWISAVERYHEQERLRRRGDDAAPSKAQSDEQMHLATVAMLRESARIYAEERPFPVDGGRVQREMENAIQDLRGAPGPLVGTIARSMGRGA